MRKPVLGLVFTVLVHFSAFSAVPGIGGNQLTNQPAFHLEPPVLLIGDTMMLVLGRELERALVNAGVHSVTSSCSFASGLARPSLFDWDAKLGMLSAAQRPRSVCVAVGVADRQSIETEKGNVQYGRADEWREAYSVRVGKVMDGLAEAGVRQIIWFLLPDMKERIHQEHARLVNEIVIEQATARTNTVVLFDLAPILSRRPGTYTRYVMAADGGAITVRDPDGMHLTREGAKLVSEALLQLAGLIPIR